MDMHQMDVRGRFLAQAFWSEMEKIALAAPAHEILQGFRNVAEETARAGKAMGARRFIPGTAEFGAHVTNQGRKFEAWRSMKGTLNTQRQQAAHAIRHGSDAERQAATHYLESAKQAVKDHKMGVFKQQPAPQAKGGMSIKKKLLIGAGVAGAGIAGSSMLANRQPADPYNVAQ